MKSNLNRSIRIARVLLPGLLLVATGRVRGLTGAEEGDDRRSKRGRARRPSPSARPSAWPACSS